MNITTTLPNQDNKVLNFIVFILFFFSGMSGLIYQIVWTRMLVLIFGNTLLTTSTALSVFMAGLAAGSYVFGKFADKRPRGLLRVFALLEAGVGVYALLFPLLLSVVGPLYTILYQSLAGSLAAVNLIRFGICFVLIVVPTFLMGAALPVLTKRFVKNPQTIGRHVGLLYGLNTTGAVVGSVICGFLFLKLLGMHMAAQVAVGINLLVALLAWVLGKEKIIAKEPGKNPDKKLNVIKDKTETLSQEYSSATVKVVFIGIGISGFCALAYELSWKRMLNMFFHNTVYSFTTILAAFLTGIALGSLVYSIFLSRIANKVRLFIIVEIGIGFFAYITPFIFNMLYDPVFSKSTGTSIILQAVVIMIAPTILMGIALPLAVQICQRGPKHEGASVGTVYAVNTIGSILGIFIAGFVFLPHLGIQKSVAVVVGFNILAALLVLISTTRDWARWFYGFSFSGLLVILIIIAPTRIFRSLYQEKQPKADLAYYKEGKIANVMVYDFYKNGYKNLYLNSLEKASSRLWHVQFFKMLGTLPVVAHTQPDDALMIDFGAGISAGACIDLVNHFECTELNHDIFEEADFFKTENRDVIHNPKLNMIFNDGRNCLLLAPKKYSLIISNAANPLTFDSWTFYTKEFYELCQQKLKPKGVFCQWVPIPLPKDAIKVILKTFKTVFPHTSLWGIYGGSQYLVLATPERLKIDYRELTKKLPRVLKTSGLTEYGVDTPDKFLSFFLLGEDQLDKYLQGFATINTDDLPGAQFHAGINREGMQTGLEMLKYQETIEPYLTNIGEEKDRLQASLKNYLPISRLLNLGFLLDNKLIYKKALVFAANVNRADDQNILYMLDYGPRHKEYFLERVIRYPADANAHNSMGYIYWKEGNYKDAISEFQQAITLNPDFVNARVNLAQTYIDASLYDQGVEELLAVVDMNPTLDILNMTRAELRIVHFLQKLRYHKNDPKLYIQLGNTYAEREEINEAIKAYNQAAELQNSDPNILTALALLYESVDLVDKSLEYLERLAKAFPGDVNLQEKIKELHAIQIDEQARENWISERITPKKEPTVHFPGCDRAAKKWNEFDFEGKISPQNLRLAAAEFEKVIKIEKRHMHAYADAAAIYEYLKEYGKAADLWRQGLQVSTSNQIAANNIQRLMLLEELTYRNPSFQRRVSLYNDIGVLYWKNGEIERAIHYFKKAVSDQPDHAMAWANLGANYIEAGKYQEALQVIEYALKLSPDIEFGKQMQARLQWLKELLRGVNNER